VIDLDEVRTRRLSHPLRGQLLLCLRSNKARPDAFDPFGLHGIRSSVDAPHHPDTELIAATGDATAAIGCGRVYQTAGWLHQTRPTSLPTVRQHQVPSSQTRRTYYRTYGSIQTMDYFCRACKASSSLNDAPEEAIDGGDLP
jgi:hypothetical protein